MNNVDEPIIENKIRKSQTDAEDEKMQNIAELKKSADLI
jgi:hypothetical protein